MTGSAMRDLAMLRLAAQRLAPSPTPTLPPSSPGGVVSWMLAMQAQDFAGAKWSIGIRLPGVTDSEVESAIARREFVRSWPMRGTLQFVAGEDLGWILSLTAPRQLSSMARRRSQLGISDDDLVAARGVAERELAGGSTVTREALLTQFERAGQPTGSQRGYHLLVNLSLQGVIVFGPVAGKQHTFALLEEWVRHPRVLSGEEALGELAARYFASHGPATDRDLARWSSLSLTETRRAIAAAGDRLDCRSFDDTTYYLAPGLETATDRVLALPGFDELLLGYEDRTATLDPNHAELIVPGGNGVFRATVVSGGRVVGTWRRTEKPNETLVTAEAFEPFSRATQSGLERSMVDYGRFTGKPARLAD